MAYSDLLSILPVLKRFNKKDRDDENWCLHHLTVNDVDLSPLSRAWYL